MRYATVIIAAAAVLAATPAAAVDFGAVMLDQDDKPLSECQRASPVNPQVCLEEIVLTLGRVVFRALSIRAQDEASLPGEDQVRRGALALRLYKAKGDVPLDADEISLIKKMIAKSGYGPVVVYQAWLVLDPVGTKKIDK